MTPTQQTQARQPERRIKAGPISVSVFANDAGHGVYRTAVLERRYQNKQTGTWETSNSYGAMELATVIVLSVIGLLHIISQEEASSE